MPDSTMTGTVKPFLTVQQYDHRDTSRFTMWERRDA